MRSVGGTRGMAAHAGPYADPRIAARNSHYPSVDGPPKHELDRRWDIAARTRANAVLGCAFLQIARQIPSQCPSGAPGAAINPSALVDACMAGRALGILPASSRSLGMASVAALAWSEGVLCHTLASVLQATAARYRKTYLGLPAGGGNLVCTAPFFHVVMFGARGEI